MVFLRTCRCGAPIPWTATPGGGADPTRGDRVEIVEETGVYRTESGMIFRVSEDADGHLTVGVLKDATWVEARIGVVGLRRSPTTVRLTAKQILRLPA
jgi:hypothetical protein